MRRFLLSTAAVLIASAAAQADVYIPEGMDGTVLHLDNEFNVVERISGLDNVHGLAGAPKRGLLIAGSLSETNPGMVEKPETVSEEDHAAHHGGGDAPAPDSVSLVTLVDAKSHEILRRIDVPGIVHHVEVSADERYAMVTHPALDSVSVIDLDAGEVTATVATGPIPEYAIANPSTGRFFVSNAGNDTVSDVDPEAGIVTRNFRLQGAPKHMLIDADARQLIVSEAEAGTVAIIDTETGETLNRFDIGGDLHGVAADEATVWSSARERDRVVRIDRASGKRLEAKIGAEPYHMARVGDALVVSSAAENVVWILDPSTLELRETIKTASTGHQFVEMN
ncbi:MAG: YncE family protein [Rhodobacteraceae bacterium]|nr:YncE family protein [Paracoccaceae bacterium]